MKKILINLLCCGCSNTKKYKVKDFAKYRPGVAHLIFQQHPWGVSSRNNDFWKDENKERREQLRNDINNVKRTSSNDQGFFLIINRLNNGDRYGISLSEK